MVVMWKHKGKRYRWSSKKFMEGVGTPLVILLGLVAMMAVAGAGGPTW